MDKEDALAIIFKCVDVYKTNLLNTSVLFVYKESKTNANFLEVTFLKNNFLHMTGLNVSEKNISANEFFNRCLTRRLKISDFEFSEDGMSTVKLSILHKLLSNIECSNMIGTFDSFRPKLYTEKIAGSIFSCMGFVKVNDKKTYIPNTVLCGNVKDFSNETKQIIATFKKKRNSEAYKDLVYKTKNCNIDGIEFPDEIKYLKCLIK